MHKFSVAAGGDWTGGDVEALLLRYHIPVFHREFTDKQHESPYRLQVRDSQAVWAEYIMARAGVPLLIADGEWLNPRHAQMAGSVTNLPPAWSRGGKPKDFTGWCVQLLFALYGQSFIQDHVPVKSDARHERRRLRRLRRVRR